MFPLYQSQERGGDDSKQRGLNIDPCQRFRPFCSRGPEVTHKQQCDVQLLIVLLELFVEDLRLSFERFVKFRTDRCAGLRRVLRLIIWFAG